jgi:hypothetical protein
MQAPAHHIGFHPNPNQIIALEAVQSLFPADSHAPILRSFVEKIPYGGMAVLQGVLRFPPCFWMVQRGEVVVKRVVERGGEKPLFAALKILHSFQLYFRRHPSRL